MPGIPPPPPPTDPCLTGGCASNLSGSATTDISLTSILLIFAFLVFWGVCFVAFVALLTQE